MGARLVTYCLDRHRSFCSKELVAQPFSLYCNSQALVLVHTHTQKNQNHSSTVSQTTCGEKIINLLTKLPSPGDGKEISLEREEVD